MNRAVARTLALLAAIGVLVGACGQDKGDSGRKDQRIEIKAWVHSGRAAERDTIKDQVARFNRSQERVRVTLTVIPEGSYNAQVQAAALPASCPMSWSSTAPSCTTISGRGTWCPSGTTCPGT